MQFHALATDYDGTLAADGVVDEPTIKALHRLKESGRKVILVTGRTMPPLLRVFPQIEICDFVVAENGALLYDPKTGEETPLIAPLTPDFATELAKRGVPPLETGHVIVATWTPHEVAVLETIRDLRLELQIIFNKGAVMLLPTGINKATGLDAALKKLGLSRHNTVGVGDAENDEAFLRTCGASAAVDNALDTVKSGVDIILTRARSAGVAELIDRIVKTDLAEVYRHPKRDVLLGMDLEENEIRVPVVNSRILVTGGPSSGKSRFALTMLHQLMELGYQVCIIDPEGDYQGLKEAVVLGTKEQTPTPEEVLQVLAVPKQSCVVSLFATDAKEQPEMCDKLLRALLANRSRTGRPHWLLIDEAHYPLPATWKPGEKLKWEDVEGVMWITAFIDRLPRQILESVSMLVAIGDDPRSVLHQFCGLVDIAPCELAAPTDDKEHEAVMWRRDGHAPAWFRRLTPKGEHKRHKHGYLEGDMSPEHRFYFRGPRGELNLAVQNLKLFVQVAEGVDDDTWEFHLRQGDYANWFRHVVRDEGLAGVAEKLRNNENVTPAESRKEISDWIQRHYESKA